MDRWTKEEIEYLKKYYPEGDEAELVIKLNRIYSTIRTKAIRIGLKRKIKYNLEEENGMWKGGRSSFYYQRLAREKFKQECSVCKTKDKLLVHHIDCNQKNNSLNNLVIFCRSCHKKEHSKLDGWARGYSECRLCKRDSVKHNAFGYCRTCYLKTFNPEHSKRWTEKNKEKLKIYHKKKHQRYKREKEVCTINKGGKGL